MHDSWDDRIAAFWEQADDADPDRMLRTMRVLVDERGPGDADALFEWASVHDFLGREAEAVPLYRAAIDARLTGERAPRAVIQLASSLRNVGEAAAAVELLRAAGEDPVTGAAAQAFLALALHDARDPTGALWVALRAVAPTLPQYGRAVAAYAEMLTPPADASGVG